MKNLKWLIAMVLTGLMASSTLGERVSTYCFYGDDLKGDVSHIDPRSTGNLEKDRSETFTATAPTGMTFSYWGIASSPQGNIAWDKSKTGSTYTYKSPSSQPTTVCLCARFDYIDYTISIDNDGGSGGSLAKETYDIRGATITVTAPTRSGYTLSGWTVSGASGGSPSVSGNTLTIPAGTYGNLTLKANWTSNKYTISIDANGGTGGSSSPANYEPSASSQTAQITAPMYDGYMLSGWTVTGASGGSPSVSGNTLTIPANTYGNLTLKANWSAITYTIHYKPGNFTKTSQQREYQVTKAHGAVIQLYGQTYERDDDRAQDGWSLQPGGSSFDYGLGASYTNNEDITLYPHWQGEIYQITTLANPPVGGSVSGGGEYMENRSVELTVTPSTGYHFVEWADGLTDNPRMIKVTGNATYTAFFAGNGITVTYRAVGGQPTKTEKTVTFGECYGEQPTVTQKGYAFDGWYTVVDGEGDKIEPTSVVTNASNHDLYANWKPVYYVAFDGMGATSGLMENQIVPCGVETNLLANKFKKDGHEFLGWATTREKADRCEPESVVYKDCAAVTDLAEQGVTVTLYAVWKILPAYALDCLDLAVTATEEWKAFKTNDAVNGSCLRVTVNSPHSISIGVPRPGFLSFNWKGGYSSNSRNYTELDVQTPAGPLPGLGATPDMGWSNVVVDVLSAGEIRIGCTAAHFYEFCMLDNVSFTTAGVLRVTKGDGIKTIYYKRSATDVEHEMTNATNINSVLVALGAQWSMRFEVEEGYESVEPQTGTMTADGTKVDLSATKKIYEVTFHDEWLRTNEVQSVSHGDKATPPDWSREGYNLRWDADSSRVTSNMLVNAIWKKEAGPYSDALDCDNLEFSANESVIVVSNAEDRVGESYLKMTNQNAVVSAEVSGPGTLTFKWRGGTATQQQKSTKLLVKLGNVTLEAVTAEAGMSWVEVTVEITNAGTLSFSIDEGSSSFFADFCALDHVIWTPPLEPQEKLETVRPAEGEGVLMQFAEGVVYRLRGMDGSCGALTNLPALGAEFFMATNTGIWKIALASGADRLEYQKWIAGTVGFPGRSMEVDKHVCYKTSRPVEIPIVRNHVSGWAAATVVLNTNDAQYAALYNEGRLWLTNGADRASSVLRWEDGDVEKRVNVWIETDARIWPGFSTNLLAIANVTSEVMVAGYDVRIDDEDSEFALVVSAPNVYTIVFDGNGATSGEMAPQDFTYDVADSLSSNGFAKAGYTFSGWATNAVGEAVYADGAVVSNLTAEVDGVVTLYATWTPNVYAVDFDGNGATSGGVASQGFTYDAADSLSSNGFAKVGYTFSGWATNAVGEAVYADGAVVSNLTAEVDGAVTLYATWTPNEYAICFHGGEGGLGEMSDEPMTYDEETALHSNLFIRVGYTFVGWTDDEVDMETVDFADGAVVSNLTTEANGLFDLWAIWAPNVYTVVFDGNGATSGEMASQDFTYDVADNLSSNGFAKAGYTFSGWATSAEGEAVYADGAVVSNLTAEVDGVVTLYAIWKGHVEPPGPEPIVVPEPKPISPVDDPKPAEGDEAPVDIENMKSTQTYNAYLTNDTAEIVGLVIVKVTKKGKVTGSVQLQTGTQALKKFSYVAVDPLSESGETTLVCMRSGMIVGTMSLFVGTKVITGTVIHDRAAYGFTGCLGTSEELKRVDDMLNGKVWAVALRMPTNEVPHPLMNGYSYLTVTGSKKGKVKVSGVLADGTKVSVSAQGQVYGATGCVVVPVNVALYSGKMGGFSLKLQISNGKLTVGNVSPWKALIDKELYEAEWSGVYVSEEAGAPVLADGSAFSFDQTAIPLDRIVLASNDGTSTLPDGVRIDVSGTKWILPKAGKVTLTKDKSDLDVEKFTVKRETSPNPSALKLTYTAKTGTFKGSFALYQDVTTNGKPKLKKISVTVNGTVVGGIGYGTATIKKIGSMSVVIGEMLERHQ